MPCLTIQCLFPGKVPTCPILTMSTRPRDETSCVRRNAFLNLAIARLQKSGVRWRGSIPMFCSKIDLSYEGS
jgi:hypothetical protein